MVDHNAEMKESGEQYNETIEEDTEKQTEMFKVPAHGNVDHSKILHDFKKVSLVTSKKAQIRVIRASSYEPGNRAGSVTGTNSVVCSYGKFQPGRPK